MKISYHPHFKASERPRITSSSSCFTFFTNHWDMDTIEMKEDFKVLMLNRSNNVLGIINLSSGGIEGTVVDYKLLYGAALKACASSIIVAHNHPSGNLTPSEADIHTTERLVKAGKILGIDVLDHLIITKYGYLSFADEGLI